MGLAAIARAAAAIGFTAAGDTKQRLTLKLGPSGTFSAANDRTTTTYAHTVTVDAVVWDEAQKDGEDGPRAVHKMAMVKATDLPLAPEENDAATTADGKAWTIKTVETDPAGATHILTLLQ
jgi:hypothetical protein